ncbi:MAG: hypothetical protein FWE11_06695 [Defluviitaleaceae bacterium]|nr:hypothetical protein [Defluviitaleaceae bacterium]
MKIKRVIILAFICVALLVFPSCNSEDEQAVQAARYRIDTAINDVRVRVEGRPDTLGNVRVGDGSTYEEIEIDLNFRQILSDIEYDDFFVARRYINAFIEDLYNDLALMFNRTDNLIIRESNVGDLDNFETPPEMTDVRAFTIDIGRFMRTREKYLLIDTHYGNLDISSDFFYGRTVIEENLDAERAGGLRLHFEYEEDDEIGDVIVTIATKNRHNAEIHVQNPGRSALITIPLDMEFMRDDRGRLLYNAVVFIDEHGIEHGVLPRSFIDSENLYIYFNRTGTFRLTSTPYGYTTDRVNFLRDRGIFFGGNTDRYITRAEFYSALMHIHWIEDLRFDLPIQPFVDIDDENLLLRINVGQNLRVDICPRSPHVLQGFPDGQFNPNEHLRRNHMFMMLAGNIEFFGFEIDGLMPAAEYHIGTPQSPNSHWYNHINYLISRDFVPYRFTEDGVADIAPHEDMTVAEALEILFKLITTHHFAGR